MRHTVVVVSLLALLLSGCGDSAETTPTQANDSAQREARAEKRQKRKQEGARRERAVMRYYRIADVIDRYNIESVEVDGGTVNVYTGLFPKPSNRPLYTGACTMLMDFKPWLRMVRIVGTDGTSHARWFRDEVMCDLDL